MPIEYMFCFICSDKCKKIISTNKRCGLFSSVFKEIIPNNTTPTFQEVGRVTNKLNPSHFVDGIITSHGIPLTITKLIDFYSQGICTFFVCHGFQLKRTRTSTYI